MTTKTNIEDEVMGAKAATAPSNDGTVSTRLESIYSLYIGLEMILVETNQKDQM